MIKQSDSLGETPESSQGLGKILGIGLVILALFGFLSEENKNKISIAGIKRRKSKRLFYMLDTERGLTTVSRQEATNIKKSSPNRLHAVWALTADDARALIGQGQGERYTQSKKLDFAGHLLNCIGWQQVISKKGNNITRCFIYAPNCKTKACVRETEQRKAEGSKLQGVNLSCKQYVRDAYNKLRCKKFAITCNSENECGPKAPIPWKPVDVEYTPKAIKSVAKVLAEEMNQSIDDTKRVMRGIKYHGGIAPYAGGYLQEEYRDIPSKYKSKEGIKLDELAQEMEMNESELVEAIGKAEEARSRLPRGKRRFTVKDLMFDAENYLHKQESGLSGLGELPSEMYYLQQSTNGVMNFSDWMKGELGLDPIVFGSITLMELKDRLYDRIAKRKARQQRIKDNKPLWESMEYGNEHDQRLLKGIPIYIPKLRNMTLEQTFLMAKGAEKKIAEKGGQMTLFGRMVARKIAMRA